MPTRVGDKVRLLRTTDTYTRLRPGATGKVDYVDAMGTLHVEWDSGERLGLIPGTDVWEIIS